MLTKYQSRKLKRLIKNYVDAAVDNSWAGGVHPDERDELAIADRNAFRNLMEYIRKLDNSSERSGS